MLADGRRDALTGRGLVVGLDESGPAADHLTKCPERDAVPIRGAAPGVPPDSVYQPVDVLEELPRQPRLPDPTGPDDAHQTRPTLPDRCVEVILELSELLVSTDERRFEGLAPTPPAALPDHPNGSPRGNGRGFALQGLIPRRLERHATRGALGRLAHKHHARSRCCLKAGSGIDHVPGDHALVRCPDRDGSLAGQDPRSSLDPGAERTDRIDELEGGPHRSLCVILAGDRGTPDRHHGITDEFLHGAAVAADDVAGDVEIAGQDLADILGVLLFGERSEPDEVREQHRDDPPLGRGLIGPTLASRRVTRGGRIRCRCGSGTRKPGGAFTAELGARLIDRAA